MTSVATIDPDEDSCHVAIATLDGACGGTSSREAVTGAGRGNASFEILDGRGRDVDAVLSRDAASTEVLGSACAHLLVYALGVGESEEELFPRGVFLCCRLSGIRIVLPALDVGRRTFLVQVFDGRLPL